MLKKSARETPRHAQRMQSEPTLLSVVLLPTQDVMPQKRVMASTMLAHRINSSPSTLSAEERLVFAIYLRCALDSLLFALTTLNPLRSVALQMALVMLQSLAMVSGMTVLLMGTDLRPRFVVQLLETDVMRKSSALEIQLRALLMSSNHLL